MRAGKGEKEVDPTPFDERERCERRFHYFLNPSLLLFYTLFCDFPDLFKEHELDFLSVRENLDSSTAIGKVVIGIIGLLSVFERELTGKRVKASAIAKARQKLGCDTKRISATSFDRAVIDFLSRASKDQSIIINAIGNAIKESTAHLDRYDKEIRQLRKNSKNRKIRLKN